MIHQNLTDKFEAVFSKKAEYKDFTPYRICPVGAHVDHNLGKITGFAINKGIHIAYSPDERGTVTVSSLQFEGVAQWDLSCIPSKKQGDWADHLRGVTIALMKKYTVKIGITALIEGELPIGGLSSSAAVIISFLNALCFVNEIHLSDEEIIDISRESENLYVGVGCGKLDQSCEVYCRKDKLLTMDLYEGSRALIPKSEKMADFDIIIFFSGLERSLASSGYNNRVSELRQAAFTLKSLSGMECKSPEETNMREVPCEVYLEYKSRLNPISAKRAEHYFTEMQRVEEGINAWKSGDIEAFGRVSALSGESSINNWEAGSPELIKMHGIINSSMGVYGGRFSGAGFKGCCVAFADPKYSEEIMEKVRAEYLDSFPHLKDKYTACICETADGVGEDDNDI